MIKWTLLFFPFLYILPLLGQEATGTVRVDQLVQEAARIQIEEPERAEALAEEAFELSEELDYQQGLYGSALRLGILYRDQDNQGKATRFARSSLEAARAINSEPAQLESLSLLITIYRLTKRQQRLQEAELEYRKLKHKQEIEQSASRLQTLKSELEVTEQQNLEFASANTELEETLDSTIQEQEALRTQLALRQVRLENEILRLAQDSIQRELEIAQQQEEIQAYDAQVRRQRLLQILLIVGLAVALIFLWIIYQNFRLKRLRTAERAKAQRQLMMQEKMASLGQLTAGIAHEIKNPLNFVNNFSEGSIDLVNELEETLGHYKQQPAPEQLALCEELAGELKQNAVDIKENGTRIDRIVKSMMEQASGNQGEIQSVQINQLVRETLNLAHTGYRGLHPDFSAHVDESYDDQLPLVEIIPQDISRALLNIIGNACYALHQKQQRGLPDYTPTLKVATSRQDETVKISIWDNGPGIPEEIRKQIFTPFFTTKPVGDGNTGLGLSISNDIVQGHHGTLDVESEPAAFTRFVMTLPL